MNSATMQSLSPILVTPSKLSIEQKNAIAKNREDALLKRSQLLSIQKTNQRDDNNSENISNVGNKNFTTSLSTKLCKDCGQYVADINHLQTSADFVCVFCKLKKEAYELANNSELVPDYLSKGLTVKQEVSEKEVILLDKKCEIKSDNLVTDLTKNEESLNLSSMQYHVLKMISDKKSIFFSGAAGCGKSYILKILKDVFKQLNLEHSICFTAPTAVAACNVAGTTLHSWAGIGLGKKPLEELVSDVNKNTIAKNRWKKTEILVIDEVSMLPADLFDKLSFIGKRIRGSDEPFGGIQLVLTGDFFQLPPVGSTNFCFESSIWKALLKNDSLIILDKIFRQKESTFLKILNETRFGKISNETKDIFYEKVRESNKNKFNIDMEDITSSVKYTKLYSRNKDVDEYNTSQLQKLTTESFTYQAIDTGKDPYLNQLKSGIRAAEVLELRIGAQVMLLKNVDPKLGLVNGSRGIVVGFSDALDEEAEIKTSSKNVKIFSKLPVVKFICNVGNTSEVHEMIVKEDSWTIEVGDRIMAEREQIPLMLAWAISIHKSQGLTIPFLEISMNGIFEFGQAYVALSRAVDLKGLRLLDFDPLRIKTHPKVLEFYASIASQKSSSSDKILSNDITIAKTLNDLTQEFRDKHAKRVKIKQAEEIKAQPDDIPWFQSLNRSKATSKTEERPSKKHKGLNEWLE